MGNQYAAAKEIYAAYGVDTEEALKRADETPISIHCWQGDDVGGFEQKDGGLTGGIQATGNYPGKATTPAQLRQDIEKVLSMTPGRHKISVHALYAETGGKKVDRNELRPEHFDGWIDWAKENSVGLDFNPSLFSHPMSDSGFTLSSLDEGIRNFWIEHCIASRKIAEHMGKELGQTAVTNLWIPDGFKDIPIDRYTPRKHLNDALDRIFAEETPHNLDSVESKVFGIGSESCVIGSHEFYMGYAVAKRTLLTLDVGHFHPTESIANKITGVIDFVPGILLHLSRPVRWDSDHVVILDDELELIMQEIKRHDLFHKLYIGLDFFDASINRIAAWLIGARNARKALLMAMLEPTKLLMDAEHSGDYTSRLAILEDIKTLPWGAVWEEYCARNNMPGGWKWLDQVKDYEKTVLAQR